MKTLQRKSLILMLLLALGLSVLVGCQQTATEESVPPASSQASEPASSESGGDADWVEVTDMAGRTVKVPPQIDKAFSSGAVAAIFLYTLAPDHLANWNYTLNDLERRIILPEYQDLPDFGQGDSTNYEAVIEAAPDVAITVATASEASKEAADDLADKLGIPVLIVSSDMKDTAEVYRFLGKLLGIEERGEELASYVDKTFADIAAAVVPDEDKVTIYYGNGAESLETAPRGSAHAQIIDMVNAVNVAELEGGSRVTISLEQLLAWDPQVIIVNGEPKQDMTGNNAATAIMNDPDFATIQAVQSGRVYGGPKAPFSWIDRPPGPNRVIGLRWLAKLVYPELYDYEIEPEVRSFYKLFYHTDLTDEQLQGLFND